MAAYLYDEALLEKLNKWTEKSNIHIYGVNETKRLFEVISDESKKDSNIKLPIICLSRNSGYKLLNTNKTVLSYDGVTVANGNGKSAQLNAIPIQLDYQLDVYTRYFKEADAISRELVFNVINHPSFEIVVPYDDVNYTHNATLRLSDTIEDNSNIPERLIAGQFTRLSINLNVDDAYLFDVRIRNNVSIDAKSVIEIRSSETDVVQEDL